MRSGPGDPVTNQTLLEEIRANRTEIHDLRAGQLTISTDLSAAATIAKSNASRITTVEGRMWSGVAALIVALASLIASGADSITSFFLSNK